jgi:nicotinamidase-related amidase
MDRDAEAHSHCLERTHVTAPNKQALLVMDIEPLVVPAFGGDEALLDRLAGLTAAARTASVPVIFGRVAFRPGYPDVSADNQIFHSVKDMMDFTEANPDTGYHPKVAPQDGDIAFTKRRVSSFTGSDLDVILRSLGVRHVVLTGVATSLVVLSTLREAADKDYQITVLSDGCADGDPQVHDFLMEKVFPAQATVTTIDEWTATLS